MKVSKEKNVSYGLVLFIGQRIKKPSDIIQRESFFAKMYDDLYHDLALKRLKIQKKVLRLIEFLALPPEQHKEKELILCCNQIKKVRKEVYKEEMKKKLTK